MTGIALIKNVANAGFGLMAIGFGVFLLGLTLVGVSYIWQFGRHFT